MAALRPRKVWDDLLGYDAKGKSSKTILPNGRPFIVDFHPMDQILIRKKTSNKKYKSMES